MRPRRKPVWNRYDVPLGRRGSMVLHEDPEGFALRILMHRPRREYATPKIRVSREQLESMLVSYEHFAVDAGEIVVSLSGQVASVSLGGHVVGACRRQFVRCVVQSFLARHDRRARRKAKRAQAP